MLFPVASLETCSQAQVNELLTKWGHKMGPCTRPANYGFYAHVLKHEGEPIACSVAAGLVRDHVGGGLNHLTRDNTIELARLCATRRDLCRAMLRLWRELIFPSLGKANAISYQDSVLHSGDVYRFDGWQRLAEVKASGTDMRTMRKGRPRVIWGWPPTRKDPP